MVLFVTHIKVFDILSFCAYFIFFKFFFFFFLLYNIVLVLPYFDMNLPRAYMC